MAKTPNLPAKPEPSGGPAERDPTQDSLFREIDEDLQQERLESFWKRWGVLIIAACVALVAGVGGWEAYSAWQRSAAEAASARFSAALSHADPIQRAAALDGLLADAPSGYQVVAALRRGAASLEQGDTTAAATAYRAAAAASEDPAIDDLAVLLTVLAAMQAPTPTGDRPDYAALAVELQPLTGPGRSWRYSALELEALLVLESGDEARARELFRALADDRSTPATIQARVHNFDRFFASR